MFTQSCFIWKNSPELREKLKKLGYYVYDLDMNKDSPADWCTVIESEAGYAGIWNKEPKNKEKFLDCGTNEELFLALAALQDDTDDGQWFVYPESDYWFKCDVSDIEAERNDPSTKMSCQSAWFYKSHKATPEELIKHFNHG